MLCSFARLQEISFPCHYIKRFCPRDDGICNVYQCSSKRSQYERLSSASKLIYGLLMFMSQLSAELQIAKLSAHHLQDELGEGLIHTCIYCQLPCEADIFSQEPTWSCSWCRATTHVRCYHQFHAHALQKASAEAKQPQKGKKADRCDSEQTLKLPDFNLTGTQGSKRSGKKSR